MTPQQSAMVLTLLAALYGGVLVLFAPELNFFDGETDFLWLPGAVTGLVLASPSFLALWAVHGRQRRPCGCRSPPGSAHSTSWRPSMVKCDISGRAMPISFC